MARFSDPVASLRVPLVNASRRPRPEPRVVGPRCVIFDSDWNPMMDAQAKRSKDEGGLRHFLASARRTT